MKCPFNCGCDKEISISSTNRFIEHIVVPILRKINKETREKNEREKNKNT
jgi:hypothetical protein